MSFRKDFESKKKNHQFVNLIVVNGEHLTLHTMHSGKIVKMLEHCVS